jgi:hypothetical protein
MKYQNNEVVLEKADLIRLNRLVRSRTDYGGFRDWYGSLNADEQATLTSQLCHFAYQAGVDDAVFEKAAHDAGLSGERGFLALAKKVRGPSGLNLGGFTRWLRSAAVAERERAFRFFVYLFGEAERGVIQKEDRRTCNHWWHRNLDDPRVVQNILDDPEYYKSSPRNDT